ncbi:Arylacetamide deacetylase [Handroanthus impetiginosus]|uniref:Arylacetamide deacetylase n=1 Tax=Handroanthus impetiginosus TaxID=429701 RepID=A0A2G9GSC6_9LAMI|nr:Arylacetamide deacetylase [Handroanthus impetiginosus]
MASPTTAAAATVAANTTTKQILVDLSPIIKVYTDGTVERPIASPYVPPSPEDPTTAVASKDTATTPATRLHLPKLTTPTQKIPILVYFHGGGFLMESAFSFLDHRYLNILSSKSNALIISVEYRLAPEHPLPAAYEDSWTALKWVCSHILDKTHFEKDPWITNHADFNKLYIGGDSAGANIAHNMAMRAGSEPLPGKVKITGTILCHPYFWGSNPIGNETKEDVEQSICYRIWELAYPNAAGGIDNPMINPIGDGAPSLSGLGCSKLLVSLAEKDILTERGMAYVEKVKESGWKGDVEVVVVEGEDHCFQIFDPESEN